MTEPDRRQRLVTSTPRLAPEEVASRSFSTRVRGYADAEVRAFLKRVAEDMVQARAREEELLETIDTLEEELRAPRPLSEQELLDSLGEETARLLRSAREAGDDIRRKADERAAEVLDEANEIAGRVTADAEVRAGELGAAIAADADVVLDAARQQGRDMLEEAKAARERVLADLIRRRALLQAQIEALRVGRDQLLDAYRTVKRTFLDATEALAGVEARSAAERSSVAGEPIDIAAEIAAEIELLDRASDAGDAIVDLRAGDAGDLTEVLAIAADDDEPGPGALADVDSLFARIRAGHADLGAEPGAPDEPAGEAAAGAVVTIADDTPETEPAADAQPTGEARSASAWREMGAAALDPLLGPLVKRTKRTVQDDQNALLDAVRRHKGRPTAAHVLPDLDALVASWGEILQDSVDQAYAAGRVAGGGDEAAADPALVREAVETVVTPLRQRITVAIDSGEEGDTGGLVERIGARYREWKNQSLEPSLAEVLALAWSRGVYEAAPDGAVLWWVPFEEGRCSDCDDNALEPTIKGESFPTGQPCPPAHPGCRCLLAPSVLLDTSTDSTESAAT